MNKNVKYKLNYLSSAFFEKYNANEYPEIENKSNRPYMVVLVKIKSNTFAIPFRTNIPHNNCYKFKNSSRPTHSTTGLDYTKAVIVNDSMYIGEAARIDDKEYVELNKNFPFIIKQFKKFVSDYINFANGQQSYYVAKKFRFTTLKYFENELINKTNNKTLDDIIKAAKESSSTNQQEPVLDKDKTKKLAKIK